MRVLVLGGTGFVGRTLVEHLLGDGHEVVLFNRGRSKVFDGLENRIGDRAAGDYDSLRTGRWDAVADMIGYLPRDVRGAMDVLGERVGRYLFVSSHAVFDGGGTALRPAISDAEWPLTDDTYGPSKVACEQAVTARYADRATIVRPCKVAGPYDDQDGLTHWVRAAARGGPVELAGDPAQPIQLVDSRDLARLMVRLLVGDRGGAFTAAGEETDFAGLIRVCAEAAGTEADIVRVPATTRFPLVHPPGRWPTMHRVPAPEMGRPTPLPVTVRDVLAWVRRDSAG